jgi:hypothetical protein
LAFALSGKIQYRDKVFEQLASWMSANPYPLGINWISGIELGIRLVNLFFALRYMGLDDLSDDENLLLGEFIETHANHLYRYPSKYSSCANHALTEALGMLTAGLCCPSHPKADSWRGYGREVLDHEVMRQIYPDGSSFEHSVPYLQFVADHFLIYRKISEWYGHSWEGALDERMQSTVEFLRAITDKHGNFPLIGDDDDGYLVKLWLGDHNNVTSLLDTGAILYHRPDWASRIGDLDLKTKLLLGGSAAESWTLIRQDAVPPRTHDARYFPNAGFAVCRSRENDNEVLFIGNNGPLGLVPLAGHGHADALSVWLSVNGQPMLIDPGTYLYHSGGAWRSYFRSTAAHNTIRVDQQDQAEIAGDFMYADFYAIDALQFDATADAVTWKASHDGYRRLSDPLLHRREVCITGGGKQIRIVDVIEALGRHSVECFFHFDPQCSVAINDAGVLVRSDAATLEMTIDSGWQRKTLERAASGPGPGWYSPRFNRLQESATLVLSATTVGNATFETYIDIKCDA